MRSAHMTHELRHATMRALNYSPLIDRLRARSTQSTPVLRDVTKEIGRAYAKVLTRVACAPEFGEELLSQVDLFAIEPEGRWIRGDLMSFCEDLRIRRGDILVAGAGQIGESTLFGRALIADTRLVGKLAAGDVMVLRAESPDADEWLYVYAFLLSDFGLRAIRACAYGTSIPRMRPDLLSQLPIPIPETKTVKLVAELIRKASTGREKAHEAVLAARRTIESSRVMKEAAASCTRTTPRASMWAGDLPAICARPFVSVGGALQQLLAESRTRVADLLQPNGAYFGLLRQRTPCSAGHGVQLVSQRDSLSVRPLGQWIARPRIERRAVFCEPNTIVTSGKGGLGEGHSVGVPALVTARRSHFAYNEDLLRLVPNPSAVGLLYAFLSTRVGRQFLRSTAAGTIVSRLRVDFILRLPVPEVSESENAEVQDAVVRATLHLDEASEAEANALALVEETVRKWLD